MITLNSKQYDELELVRKVLANMPVSKKGRTGIERWVRVNELFGIGTEASRALCVEFGFDPNQNVHK